jgi:hypothetical protein
MSSLPKGESMGTKLVGLFADRVVERRNMINDYLRGELALRVLRGVDFRGSVDFEFLCSFRAFLALLSFSELFLAILLGFTAFCAISYLLRFSFF